MQNGVERFALVGAGKNHAAQRAAIEHIAIKDAVAECLSDRWKRGAAGGSQAVGDGVSIGNDKALRAQISAHGTLAAGDGAGQSDFHR